MSARLSFAIATAVSPEILIVDEVLGAGDGYFAFKATVRMREMCDRGKALLFVSHSNAAIRMLCNEAIWIENGVIRHKGPTDHVLFKYEEDVVRRQEETQRAGNMRRLKEQLHMVTPEDIGDLDLVRLRLRSEEAPWRAGHPRRPRPEPSIGWSGSSDSARIRRPSATGPDCDDGSDELRMGSPVQQEWRGLPSAHLAHGGPQGRPYSRAATACPPQRRIGRSD